MSRAASRLLHACAIAALCLVGAAAYSPRVEAQASQKSQRAAKAPAKPKPANIDKNGVFILVKTAIIALDQANKTGNYTVLRDLGSANFQENTAARLAEIFAPHRAQQLDLAGIVVLEPQLTLLPQIEPNGMLHMAGFFPSVPTQVNFELLYEAVDRKWQLYGISVNLSSGGPTAPETAPQPAPSASNEPPEPPTASIEVVPVPSPKPPN